MTTPATTISIPYDHPPTKALRDELDAADPTLAATVDKLLGPFTSGYVTVAHYDTDSKDKILWYLCDPEQVGTRCAEASFEFDWDYGHPGFSMTGDVVTYHPIGTGDEVL